MAAASSSVRETAYYDLLGVPPDATVAEIRKGYRRAALKCHPDRAGDTEEAKEAFQSLQRAYNALFNVETRRVYDQFGEAGLSEEADGVGAAFARANGARAAPISAEDIEQFAMEYRFSDMEREDLALFFRRFDGDVRKVLDFIPYSEPEDLERYVDIFDKIVEEEGEKMPKYNAAKKTLLKRVKGIQPRQQGAPTENSSGKKKGGKKKKEDGMSSLVAAFQARNAGRAAEFDSFVDGLADKYGNADATEKKKKKSGGKAGSSSLGVSKKRKKVSKKLKR